MYACMQIFMGLDSRVHIAQLCALQVGALLRGWCCNPIEGQGGPTISIDAIQRPVLSKGKLADFSAARARLRNPYAPLFRLFLAGADRGALLRCCGPEGFRLPEAAGEFGKGLDFLGALRPACVKPWEFPPGRHVQHVGAVVLVRLMFLITMTVTVRLTGESPGNFDHCNGQTNRRVPWQALGAAVRRCRRHPVPPAR